MDILNTDSDSQQCVNTDLVTVYHHLMSSVPMASWKITADCTAGTCQWLIHCMWGSCLLWPCDMEDTTERWESCSQQSSQNNSRDDHHHQSHVNSRHITIITVDSHHLWSEICQVEQFCLILEKIPHNSPRTILFLFNDHRLATSRTRANSWWHVQH